MKPFSRHQFICLTICLWGYVLFLFPQVFAQGIPLDAPSAPMIQLIDRHYRLEIGTGFLLELDLAALPEQTGTVSFQPVSDVDQIYVTASPRQRPSIHGDKPFEPLIQTLASFGSLGRKPSVELLPLPLQPVLPLDSGVVLDKAGNLHVLQRPPSGRIRLFVPQLFAFGNNRLFLILGNEGKTFYYLRSPNLYADRELPDVDVALLATEPGRYLGAQGQWVRLSYHAHLPPQVKGPDLQLHLLLNEDYQVANPLLDGPAPWPTPYGKQDELRCFVPDALTRPDGSLELDLVITILGYETHKLISRQKIVLQGRQPTQTLSIRFSEIAQWTRPATTPADDYANYYILYMVGGTCVHASDKADDGASTHLLKSWKDLLPAELPLGPYDQVGIVVCIRTPDWFLGSNVLDFQLSAADFPRGAKSMEVVKKFKNAMGVRYRWTLRAEYEWLESGPE